MGIIIFSVCAVILGVTIYLYRKDSDSSPKKETKTVAKSNMTDAERLFVESARVNAMAKKNAEQDKKDAEKVLCSYCDSYVDIDENEICPNCGASLKEQIQEALKKKQMAQVALIRAQAEIEKEKEKRERSKNIRNSINAAALSALVPGAGRIYKNSKKKK